MWDITNVTSEQLNDDFWSFKKGALNELVDITHRGGGLEEGFDDVLYNPSNLQKSDRAAGELVFDSKLLRFIDSIETKVGATTTDALAAFKELYKASGGKVEHFKQLFKDKIIQKISDKITVKEIDSSFDDLAKIADFDVLDATTIDPFDDVTKITSEIIEESNIKLIEDVDAPLLKGIKRSEGVLTNLKRPVLKGVYKSVAKSNTVKNASKIARQVAKKSKTLRGAFKGLKPGIAKTIGNMGKVSAKVAAKGVGRAVDMGVVDAIFVVVDSIEDVERVDEESVYTGWNGVPIHKKYSPDEYAYINALKSMYHLMGGFETLQVPIDGFLNTWFGRVSESEDGTLMIDGEEGDLNVFLNPNNYSVATARSSEGVQLDSKTELIAKNVGKGLLSFLTGAAIMTAAVAFAPVTGGASLVVGAAASVGAGIAIEAADEAIEAVSIGERANNFNQAFQKKIINDYLDEMIINITNIYGPIHDRKSLAYERRLINRVFLYNDNAALNVLNNQYGYPKNIVKYVGKILRYNIQRINTDLDYETSLEVVIDDTMKILGEAGNRISEVNKTRIELNKYHDDLYEKTAADLNQDLNLLYENITDEDSGLTSEEIKEIVHRADKIVNGDNERKTREYRNLQLKNIENAIDEMVKDTQETIEQRKNFQAEVDKVNEELTKIKKDFEDQRKKILEAAEDVGEAAEELEKKRQEIISAGKSVQEAAAEIEQARQDLNKRLQEERDRKIGELEQEIEETIVRNEREAERLQERAEKQKADKEQGPINLEQGKFEEGDLNYDRGLPEREEEGFEPTGRALAFTFDTGAPKMLFESGEELEYTGPSNALSGGITQGNWTGVIPNANKAPVNLLDNYYMAYHIENQNDESLAKGRLVKRITRALNKKVISPEKDIIEHRIALLTLEHMKRYKNIFGIEISNAFMQNGLGAIIRDQVYETITNPIRNGSLPQTFSLPQDVNLDFTTDSDSKGNLKRARDIALAGGDRMMGAKFQRVQAEVHDMERVAVEYIQSAQSFVTDQNISLGMDRLNMENIMEIESKEEAFAKLIISILNKPLLQIIS